MSKVTMNGNTPITGGKPAQQYDTTEHPFELRHEIGRAHV